MERNEVRRGTITDVGAANERQGPSRFGDQDLGDLNGEGMHLVRLCLNA